MLVNPSIYNNMGRFTSNYDLMSLQRKSGNPTATSPFSGFPYKNSLTEKINQQTFQQISNFDFNFKTDLKSIANTVKALANGKSNIYDDRKAVEQSKAFDVSAEIGATIGKQSLKVTQLATAQKNTSLAKAQNDTFASDAAKSLTIKQNGKSNTIDFSFKANETAADGYLRLSKTINQSKIGVTAEVKTDETGYARLSITSKETGKASNFEVSGTMAEELKLNDNKQDAQNMTYELNGKAAESESNQLSLEKGKVLIDVKATNTAAEDFSIEASSKSLVSTLKDFATAFNKFVADNKNSTNPMTKSLVNQFSNTVAKSLDKLGVDGLQTSNGQIVLDESKLNKSLENRFDAVKNELTKFDSFATSLSRKTDQVLKMPLNEITPDFSEKESSAKAFIYNYTAQSALSTLSQMNSPGSIMDVWV